MQKTENTVQYQKSNIATISYMVVQFYEPTVQSGEMAFRDQPDWLSLLQAKEYGLMILSQFLTVLSQKPTSTPTGLYLSELDSASFSSLNRLSSCQSCAPLPGVLKDFEGNVSFFYPYFHVTFAGTCLLQLFLFNMSSPCFFLFVIYMDVVCSYWCQNCVVFHPNVISGQLMLNPFLSASHNFYFHSLNALSLVQLREASPCLMFQHLHHKVDIVEAIIDDFCQQCLEVLAKG